MKAELRIFINEDNESGTVILELENMKVFGIPVEEIEELRFRKIYRHERDPTKFNILIYIWDNDKEDNRRIEQLLSFKSKQELMSECATILEKIYDSGESIMVTNFVNGMEEYPTKYDIVKTINDFGTPLYKEDSEFMQGFR